MGKKQKYTIIMAAFIFALSMTAQYAYSEPKGKEKKESPKVEAPAKKGHDKEKKIKVDLPKKNDRAQNNKSPEVKIAPPGKNNVPSAAKVNISPEPQKASVKPSVVSASISTPSKVEHKKSVDRQLKQAERKKIKAPDVSIASPRKNALRQEDSRFIKDLNKSLDKISKLTFDKHPLDTRGQGNMSKNDMMDPYGLSKDDRMDIYGNRGRVIKEPLPEPEPDPVPVPEPDPVPVPEPEPEPVPEPTPEPEPVPVPEPAPEPEPEPEPAPEPAPEPEPEPAPEPEPEPTPEPEPEPEPDPVPEVPF